MSLIVRRLKWIVGAAIALAMAAGVDGAHRPARAAGLLDCTFAMTNINFGSVDVLSGAASVSGGTLTINCSGLSFFPTTVYACVAMPTPWQMLGPRGSTLGYSIQGPPPATTPWSNTTQLSIPVTGTFFGFAATGRFDIVARLSGGQRAAPPGFYIQPLVATVTYGTLNCTSSIITVQSSSFAFNTSVTVEKSCNVAATNLSFGSTGSLRAPLAGQSSLNVQCSNGIGYSLGLNGGSAGAIDPTQRKMKFGANAITYGLYQDAANARPWGTAGANLVSGTGTSASQPYSVYGLVPAQATPPPGTYTDTIVVSVTY
jgi:spore coat protein U-like protein